MNSTSPLIDLTIFLPSLVFDIRYATTNNFLKGKLYSHPFCYLHIDAANALAQAEKALREQNLCLKIFDAYRPLAVQEKMWEILPDERYVSNPAKGGRHTRGTAIDLTLLTLDHKPVEMPTDFDDFTENAHQESLLPSLPAQKNRDLLKQVMEESGFIALPTEWWHFDLKGWEKYPPLTTTEKDLVPYS